MQISKLLLGFTLLLFVSVNSLASNWEPVAPGIEYQDLGTNLLKTWSHIHVFRIDLKKNELDLILAKNLSLAHASISEFAEKSRALIVLNGGFFDHNYHPLGLRISKKQVLNPLKRISWWGVFYIKNQKAYLSGQQQYLHNPRTQFAVQSGPRLLINGVIPALKPGLAERSALGITTQGKVIILVTENSPMTTTALANLMKSAPLHCKDALNLDGGSSSQLITNTDNLRINTGFAHVSDAIVVKPRQTA